MLDYLDISDTLITASSERNVNHAAKRVRLNSYNNFACAWSPASEDPAPWVQFDMEQEVTVSGVVVKPRCDEPYTRQRVTSFKVAKSDDGVLWQDASGVIPTDYRVNQNSVSWLDVDTTARYWRIKPLTWHIQLSMKADLIGQPKGKRRAFLAFYTSNGCFIVVLNLKKIEPSSVPHLFVLGQTPVWASSGRK